MILGIDEVGRGAWAGPLVVGACIIPNYCKIPGLTDSKKLTSKQRLSLELEIKSKAIDWGLGWVGASELDHCGLSDSLKLATKRAYEKIKSTASEIIIDGTINFLPDQSNVSTLKKADLLIPSVSAAAILAKVARDRFMINLSACDPYRNYAFANHVGYGTLQHRQAIEKYGISDQHRLSFKPIALHKQTSAKQIGDWGETVVTRHLCKNGFDILATNWRTKIFEIDIVAKKQNIIYLVEVKTRRNIDFGGGEAAFNNFKLHKMHLAASVVIDKYPNTEIRLIGITVTGTKQNYLIGDWIELTS